MGAGGGVLGWSLMATYLEQSLAQLEQFEGCIAWMYRDTVGRVTVGVGLMLPNAGSAEALPFLVGERAAAPLEVAAEYERVSGMPPGRPAEFYREQGGLELSAETVQGKLRETLDAIEGRLRGALAGYDGFPDGAKMALLDMGYNLGAEGLLNGYPRMIAAVERGDWAGAAAACLRRGPSVARNAWTRQQFLSAVVTRIEAAVEAWWKRLVWGLLGWAASVLRR